MTNPNRLRSLAGTFGGNHWAFHSPDGRGYAFLADMIIAADKLNPQIAARLVPPLGRWRRFEPKRAAMMRAGARADRCDAGPVEGRVRAGVESSPALNREAIGSAADPLRDLSARPGWRRG